MSILKNPANLVVDIQEFSEVEVAQRENQRFDVASLLSIQ